MEVERLQPKSTKGTGQTAFPREDADPTRSEIEGLVTISEVIEAVEQAHADISNGTAAQPAPAALSLQSTSARFVAMVALADRQGLAAVKLLGRRTRATPRGNCRCSAR